MLTTDLLRIDVTGGAIGDAIHGWDDLGDQVGDVQRKRRSIALDRADGRENGAALVVTEHDDERNMQHADRVFERAEHALRDDLAGVAHDEQVADALVEDDLGRESRVAAAEEGRVRRLAGGELSTALHVLPWVQRLAANEALVAADHLFPGLGGGAVSHRHCPIDSRRAEASVAKSASLAVPLSTRVAPGTSVTSP